MEQPPGTGFENLRCSRCGERFYSAAADAYVGKGCLAQGCDGTLLAGPAQKRVRAVKGAKAAEDDSNVA